jgi:hypothetical protein
VKESPTDRRHSLVSENATARHRLLKSTSTTIFTRKIKTEKGDGMMN